MTGSGRRRTGEAGVTGEATGEAGAIGEAGATGEAGEAGTPVGRPVLLVSACLLGDRCTYRADDNASPEVVALGARADLVPVCPEVEGGLTTPRPAAELGPDGRVRTAAGADVTDAYQRGAAIAVARARATGATGAVLKARSPSCGCHGVYDGTHQGVLVEGDGVAAAALRAAGLALWSEEDVAGGVGPLL